MVSDLARKLCGTYVEDTSPMEGTLAYFQEECRDGRLREAVEEFASSQKEPLDASRVIVEKCDEHGIQCRIPCRMRDHESTTPFRNDVVFQMKLSDLSTSRS